VDLRVSEADAQELMDKLNEIVEPFYEETKASLKTKKKREALKMSVPFWEEEDEEGEPTGNVIFRFKSKAVGKNNKTGETWKNQVALFDGKGKPTKVKVGGGSTIKVAAEVVPFHMASNDAAGVTLRLKAVQVIELSEFGSRSADSYGFGAEDGGFEDDGSYEDAEFDTQHPDTEGTDADPDPEDEEKEDF